MDSSWQFPDSPWLSVAEKLNPAPITLPDRAELVSLLERLGAEPVDVAELPALLAGVLADARLSWLATRFATTLMRDLGVLGLPSVFTDPTRAWPVLPIADGSAARCVYLPAFLATVPAVRALHAERGIDDATSWATLADLGRQLSIHRRTFGVAGTDTQWWTAIAWAGNLVDVGRLQAEWLRPDTVGLHIPETGPLRHADVDASLDRVRAAWPSWFGSAPTRAECVSWLLDPQLADYLPHESNILRFQRRFTLVEDPVPPADDVVLHFVFRRRGVVLPDGLAGLPRDSPVQRAVIDHLGAGGHWYFRQGWFPL